MMMMLLLMARVNTETMMTVDNDEVGDHDNDDEKDGVDDDDDDDDDDDGDDDAKPGRHASFRLTRRPQKAAQPQFLFSPHQPPTSIFIFHFCSIFFLFNFSIFCSI